MIKYSMLRNGPSGLKVFFQKCFQFWVVVYSLVAKIAEFCHVFAFKLKARAFDRILTFAGNMRLLEKRDVQITADTFGCGCMTFQKLPVGNTASFGILLAL